MLFNCIFLGHLKFLLVSILLQKLSFHSVFLSWKFVTNRYDNFVRDEAYFVTDESICCNKLKTILRVIKIDKKILLIKFMHMLA